MKTATILYSIVLLQFALGTAMWGIALTSPIRLQSLWGILLAVDLISTGLILLIIMKRVVGGMKDA